VTADERFDLKIVPEPTSGCHLWIGGYSRKTGYGSFWFNGRSMPAHQYSWLRAHGELSHERIPLDHLCRTPLCVNESHLERVTRRENILRGVGPTAVLSRRTHCQKCGGPFVLRGGFRRCVP